MMADELPGIYRRVEYLESSGTQYIYTDVPAKSGLECVADVMWIVGGSTDACIFGGRLTGSNRIMLVHQYPAQRWTLGYGSSHTDLASFDYGTKYNVSAKCAVGEQYLKIDGTTIYTGTAQGDINNSFNMGVFACTYSEQSVRLFSSARVYTLKAKMDGVDVLNFIPCIRKTDNKPGMYETVTKTFFTNSGTGEFIVPS